MILSDLEIENRCNPKFGDPLIKPFVSQQINLLRVEYKDSLKILSYGLSSYGYDARLDPNEIKVFTNINSVIVNPKNFDSRLLAKPELIVDKWGEYFIIPPNSYALGRTIEYFNISRDLLMVCLGKSTYARCGVIVNVTPGEPEWNGYITLEISNSSPSPVMIFLNEGICQFIFLRAAMVCQTSYADKKGKYQSQTGLTLAKV